MIDIAPRLKIRTKDLAYKNCAPKAATVGGGRGDSTYKKALWELQSTNTTFVTCSTLADVPIQPETRTALTNDVVSLRPWQRELVYDRCPCTSIPTCIGQYTIEVQLEQAEAGLVPPFGSYWPRYIRIASNLETDHCDPSFNQYTERRNVLDTYTLVIRTNISCATEHSGVGPKNER